MKKIKFLIYSILLIFSLVLLGESYVLSLDSLGNQYISASFFTPQMTDLDQVKEDFAAAANKFQLGFFVIDYEMPEEGRVEQHIYANGPALEALGKKDFQQGSFRSLVVGESQIYLHNFRDLDDLDMMAEVYFTHTKEDLGRLQAFKKELIDSYGGGFPRDYGPDHGLRNMQLAVFSIVFMIYFLLTMYELEHARQENFVRLVQGEDLVRRNFRLFFTDQALLLIISWLAYRGLGQVYYLAFSLKALILGHLLGFISSFFLYYLFSLGIEKGGPSRGKTSKAFLRATYVMNGLVLIMLTNLFYANSWLIQEGISYRRQADFFKSHSDYAYYQLNYKMNNTLGKDEQGSDDSALAHQDFNEQYYDRSLLMVNFSSNVVDKEAVLVNKQGLEAQALDLSVPSTDSDLLIFSPDPLAPEEQEMIEESIFVYYPASSKIEYETYDRPLKVLAVNDRSNLHRTGYIDNPILIYEASIPQRNLKNANARLYFAYSIPYRLSKEEFDLFLAKHQLENQIKKETNIYDYYRTELQRIDRTTQLLVFISGLFLALSLGILSFLIRIQYVVKRKELVLKTVLGHSLWEKNKKIIGQQALLILLALLGLAGLSWTLGRFNPWFIGGLGLSLAGIQGAILAYFIQKNEKILLVHILKGGQ